MDVGVHLSEEFDQSVQGPINIEVGVENELNIQILIKNKALYLDDLIEGEILFIFVFKLL